MSEDFNKRYTKNEIKDLSQVSNLEIDRYYRVPEPDRGYQHCDKCGNEIEVGENFYNVTISEGETVWGSSWGLCEDCLIGWGGSPR